MLSIVICTLNTRNSLEATLASIAKQSCPDYEVIVVNQSKPDQPIPWAGFARNLRVIHSQQKGLSLARNIGLKGTGGEILGFVDDDCVLDENWVQETARAFEKDSKLAAICGRILDMSGRTPYSRLHSGVEKLVTWRNSEMFMGGCLLFRKQTLEQIGDFDQDLGAGRYLGSGEDTDICYRMLRKNMKVAYEPHIVVYHPLEASSGWENLGAKLYSYGLGIGAVHAKHIRLGRGGTRFQIAFNFLCLLLKPLLRCVQYALLLQFARSKANGMVLKGRISGFVQYGRYRAQSLSQSS